MTETVLPRTHQPAAARSYSGGLSRLLFKVMSGVGRYIRWSTATMWQSVRLIGFGALEALTMVWFTAWLVVSVLGITKAPPPFEQLRRNTRRQRDWTAAREGKPVREVYGPRPNPDVKGMERLKAELADTQRAKDLDWHLVNPGITLLTAGLPLAVGLTGLIFGGLGVLRLAIAVLEYISWGLNPFELMLSLVDFYRADEALLILVLLGSILLGAPLLARAFQSAHTGWARFMLSAPGREVQLEKRVETLTQTRKTALELLTAEVQRIERDLHDGAQAHLVSVGMTLTQVSRLMRVDPDAAEAMLEAAKGDSATALKELRTLVRGIRPPVLADRGLADALRSLASGLPIEARVISTLTHRPVAAVESALYFAISELLTNAVKHSAASQITVELIDGPRQTRAVVTDNGLGGAEHQERPEGGIHGIRRRLEPFDATLDIVSPIGGGTTATILVPHPTR